MMHKKIEDILLELGIMPNLKGFNYITDMVELINREEKIKIVAGYWIVAKKYNATGARVERAIRHAISKIDTGGEQFKNIVGVQCEKHMTNSEFLSTLAYKLKED